MREARSSESWHVRRRVHGLAVVVASSLLSWPAVGAGGSQAASASASDAPSRSASGGAVVGDVGDVGDARARGSASGDALVASPAPDAAPDALAPEGAQGIQAYRRGQWSAAVALIEAVPPATRSAVEQLHLARARVQLGRLVEALDDYEWLLDAPSTRLPLPGWRQVRPEAEVEGAELARRLPWARVDLGDAVPAGASAFVDGRWVAPGRLRAPYPVNPGWHAFLLEVRGEVLAARRAYFEEGQERVVPLVRSAVEAPRGGGPPPRAITTALPATRSGGGGGVELGDAADGVDGRSLGGGRAEDAIATDLERRQRLRTGAYVAAGVGTLGAVVGSVLGIRAMRQSPDAGSGSLCSSDFASGRCVSSRSDYQHRRDEAQASARAATISFVVGVGGLATATVLYFMSEPDSAPSAEARVVPYVGLSSVGLSGRF